MEPEFKIFGEEQLLKDMTINIQTIRQATYPDYEHKIETLLLKGKTFKIQNDYAGMYKVYFSYKTDLVGVLEFENLMKNAKDYINHIYIYKEQDAIFIQYVGRKSEIEKRKGFKSIPAVALKEYLKVNSVTEEDEVKVRKAKFFNFYDPKESDFNAYIKE